MAELHTTMAEQDADPQFIDDAADHEEEDEEEDEAAAMAAMMGFSTFGTQGSSKKRKYNPDIDATIDDQALDAVDRGGKRGKGSGGNQIPLGKTRTFGVADDSFQHQEDLGGNPDEIVLDDNEEEREKEHGDEEHHAEYGDASHRDGGGRAKEAPVQTRAQGPEQNRGSRQKSSKTPDPPKTQQPKPSVHEIHQALNAPTILPLPPPAQAELSKVQAQIDAITTKTTYTPPPEQPNLQSFPPSIPSQLPNKPDTQPHQNGRSYSGYDRRDSERARGDNWYIESFDPSCLQNPWAELERLKGLGSRGTWL